MRRVLYRVLFMALIVFASWWSWRLLFPSPEQIIRKRLTGVARAASFSPGESLLAKAYNSQKLAEYFDLDVEVVVDVPGGSRENIHGRDQLQQAALLAKSRFTGFKIEFVGMNVTVAPDQQSASVNLTAKASARGEKDWVPQELNVTLRKVDGDWIISRVETVKTLL
jgi:hypothetical protein